MTGVHRWYRYYGLALALALALFWTLVGPADSLDTDSDICLLKNDQTDLASLRVKEVAEKGDVIVTLSFYGSEEQMELSSRPNDYFAFEVSTLNVIVNATLDADQGIRVQKLDVKCKVKEDGRELIHEILISIADVNDNAPVFPSNVYNITVGEMAQINSKIPTPDDLFATDEDATPPFREVYYSIVDGPYADYFAVENSANPTLLLAKPLDFEALASFSFTFMAQDYYPGTNPEVKFNSTCLIVVTVEDQDDQYPVFNSSIYRGVISRLSALGTSIEIQPPVYAYDPDKSLNAEVEYSFHGDIFASSSAHSHSSQEVDVGHQVSSDAAGQLSDYFDIVPKTGEVTLVKMPRSNEIYLLLQATQEDNPSRYGVALLTIQVQGSKSNLNAPVFTKSNYDVAIMEGFPVGEVIGTVLALDKDTGSKITYRLVNSSDLFHVDSSSGDVKLLRTLSYTSSQPYRVHIKASDGDLTDVTSLTVRILKLNHHPPRVLNGNLTVVSKAETGLVVIDIEAEDLDGQGNLSYSILSYQDIFAIDNDGVLRIIADPREIVKDRYQVSFLVSDSGHPSLVTGVTVHIHFPAEKAPVACPSTANTEDMVPFALGAVAAVLFIIVIVLVIYIMRSRLKDKEHLDRVKKQHPSRDPRVLAFKPKSFGKKSGTQLDHIEFHEDKLDGATTIQENPLSATSKSSYYNFGQLNSDTDADLDIYNGDIQVETSVVPFDPLYGNDDNNNDHIYNSSQLSVDSEDANLDKNALASFYRNESLSTYPDSDSDTSLNTSPTESNDSKKGLVSSSRSPDGQGLFWLNSGNSATSDVSNHIEMDPGISSHPTSQKQELTVYF